MGASHPPRSPCAPAVSRCPQQFLDFRESEKGCDTRTYWKRHEGTRTYWRRHEDTRTNDTRTRAREERREREGAWGEAHERITSKSRMMVELALLFTLLAGRGAASPTSAAHAAEVSTLECPFVWGKVVLNGY